jgi:TonB-dependent starch-binding outer membrane protein SusC
MKGIIFIMVLSGMMQMNCLGQQDTALVNTGYGEVKKSEFTGSSTSVSEEQLNETSGGLHKRMKGKAVGVQVNPSSDNFSADLDIRIRGIHSIYASSDPLWVVDGLQIHSVRTVEELYTIVNVHDIESIEVLKDAYSCAMYGSRGSNGVIIIKTKSGKKR